MSSGHGYVYITLITGPSYLPGLLVLHHSLGVVKSRYGLVVMVPQSFCPITLHVIHLAGITTRAVEILNPPDGNHTLASVDAHYADTWTKLRAFELVEYQRIILLDVDMLILGNMDDLMDMPLRDNYIAAVNVCACNPRRTKHYPQDWVPKNCAHSTVTSPLGALPIIGDTSPRPYRLMNSGLVVLRPSRIVADGLYHFLETCPSISSFTFPDQDLLALYFHGRWTPLPWFYNALRSLQGAHPAMWGDGSMVRCIHYIFPQKPWMSRSISPDLKSQEGFENMNRRWWDAFDAMIADAEARNKELYVNITKHITTR